MPEVKDVTLSIRTTATVKELLRLAAKREHRSAASMVERLILDHAEKYALGKQLGEQVAEGPRGKGSKK